MHYAKNAKYNKIRNILNIPNIQFRVISRMEEIRPL